VIWLLSSALAGGTHSSVHSGIPVHGVPGVGEPTFLTPATGWTASVDGGFVRVFVGHDEADAVDWYERARSSLTLTPADASGLGDEAFGDGQALFAFRDGNVAVLVRAQDSEDNEAYAWARTLHDAIVDGVPWPAAPRLEPRGDGTFVVSGATSFVKVAGGQQVPFHPGVFRALPDEVVVWDAYGRPVVATR
jgi:hypothetical protein